MFQWMNIANSELSTSDLKCHVDITMTTYIHHLISAFIHNEYTGLILIGTRGLFPNPRQHLKFKNKRLLLISQECCKYKCANLLESI